MRVLKGRREETVAWKLQRQQQQTCQTIACGYYGNTVPAAVVLSSPVDELAVTKPVASAAMRLDGSFACIQPRSVLLGPAPTPLPQLNTACNARWLVAGTSDSGQLVIHDFYKVPAPDPPKMPLEAPKGVAPQQQQQQPHQPESTPATVPGADDAILDESEVDTSAAAAAAAAAAVAVPIEVAVENKADEDEDEDEEADVVACSACNSVRCGAVVSGLKLCPQLAGNAATAPAAPAATTALAALAALVAPAAPGAES